jgi:hypothetical protein
MNNNESPSTGLPSGHHAAPATDAGSPPIVVPPALSPGVPPVGNGSPKLPTWPSRYSSKWHKVHWVNTQCAALPHFREYLKSSRDPALKLLVDHISAFCLAHGIKKWHLHKRSWSFLVTPHEPIAPYRRYKKTRTPRRNKMKEMHGSQWVPPKRRPRHDPYGKK